jgi:hypothetical protein
MARKLKPEAYFEPVRTDRWEKPDIAGKGAGQHIELWGENGKSSAATAARLAGLVTTPKKSQGRGAHVCEPGGEVPVTITLEAVALAVIAVCLVLALIVGWGT